MCTPEQKEQKKLLAPIVIPTVIGIEEVNARITGFLANYKDAKLTITPDVINFSLAFGGSDSIPPSELLQLSIIRINLLVEFANVITTELDFVRREKYRTSCLCTQEHALMNTGGGILLLVGLGIAIIGGLGLDDKMPDTGNSGTAGSVVLLILGLLLSTCGLSPIIKASCDAHKKIDLAGEINGLKFINNIEKRNRYLKFLGNNDLGLTADVLDILTGASNDLLSREQEIEITTKLKKTWGRYCADLSAAVEMQTVMLLNTARHTEVVELHTTTINHLADNARSAKIKFHESPNFKRYILRLFATLGKLYRNDSYGAGLKNDILSKLEAMAYNNAFIFKNEARTTLQNLSSVKITIAPSFSSATSITMWSAKGQSESAESLASSSSNSVREPLLASFPALH